MKLFQRIFATFCAVIVCAIFVASFSFWLVQNTLAENQFNQRRTIETTLMSSIISAFNSRGDSGAREILSEWKNNPVSNAVYVITGDDKKDILGRNIDSLSIERARIFAINNPESDLAHIEYDRFGEEYLFFIKGWDNHQAQRLPSPLFIPGLPLSPIWHEFIILSFIIIVGLLMAYILANNITKPIKPVFLNKLTTVTTNCPTLPYSSIKWPRNWKNLWPKSATCFTTFLMKCVRRWRVCRRLSA